MVDRYYTPSYGQSPDVTRYPQAVHSQLILKTAPTVEPVSVPLAKQFAIIEDSLDDELIANFITVARETVETWLSRALITQTWTLTLDALPGQIELRKPPIQQVNSIKYLDFNGVQQTLDPSIYQVDAVSEPGRIRPAFLQVWPVYRPIPNCISIEFDCGYGDDGSAVPQTIKQAILQLVALRFRNREVMTIGPSDAEEAIRNSVQSFSWGCYS